MSLLKNHKCDLSRVGLAALALGVLAAPAVSAEPTLELRIMGTAEVFAGDPETTSLDAYGVIEAGMSMTSRATFAGTSVLNLTAGRIHGSVLVGTAQGGLLEVTADGKSKQVFDANKLMVAAVYRDGREIYVASNPDGKIYRIDKNDKAKAYFDPKAKYVWSLLQDKQGLLVATGQPGQILRVGSDGKREILYEADESHIRAMIMHPERGLIFGGGEKGIIYQRDRQGKIYALYDSQLDEVTAFAIDKKSGDLFVALISEKKKGALIKQKSMPLLPDDKKHKSDPIKRSQVLRIAISGHVDILWTSSSEGALDIEFEASSNRLYIVTGSGSANRGRIYAIETDNRDRLRLMGRSEASMLSGLVLQDDGFLVGTAPAGELLHFSTKLRKSSLYISKEEDLARISHLGRLWFDAELPPKTEIALALRTGNTAKADGTWSEWSEPIKKAEGGPIKIPDGRYAQFRAVLISASGRSPRLKSMHASLIRGNIKPSVTEVYILRRGIYLKPLPREQSKEKTVTITLKSLKKLRTWATSKPKNIRARQGKAAGMLTAAWTATDINHDRLLSRIEIKPQGTGEQAAGATWTIMADDIEHRFYSFDSRAYPDGRYRVRVTVSDRPTNAAEDALSDAHFSAPFVIDNHPPVISRLNAKFLKGKRLRVSALAEDDYSILDSAEVSLNGGPWIVLPAEDGLIDAKRERMVSDFVADDLLGTPKILPGRNTVSVRVSDMAGNSTSRTTIARH